jgi:hypothetical protein
MRFMKEHQRPALLALLCLSLLFGGCASGGIFGNDDDDNGTADDRDTDRDRDTRNDRVTEVRGRVDEVDTRDEIVWVETSDIYRSDLRNGNDDRLPIYYDDQTDVEYDGKTYEPTALEEGDRVVIDVDDTGTRLYARDIEVTYDVTSNDRDDDRSVDEDDRISELRGTVRSVDQDRRVMELEDTSWGFGSDRDRDDGDLVRVYYDSSTRVEYDGRSYRPENLERGDEVRVDVRRDGSRYEADEIQVVENVRD